MSVGIEPELLTLREAAALCGVGQRTFWRLAHTGRAPRALKLTPGRSGATRWRRSELLRWIERGCPRVDGEGK